MLLSNILTLCIGAAGVSSSPVAINITPDSGHPGLIATHTTDIALNELDTALKPRATPFWTQVGHGVFWTGIGAIAQGSAWLDMIETCEEFSDNKKFSQGAACVFSALTNVVKTGIFATGSFHASMTIKNVMFPANGGGTKRSLDQDFDWTNMWDSMSIDQHGEFRSQWKAPNGLHLHRLDNGTLDLPNSITMYLSHDEDAAIPHYRHISNGTHGMIHSMFGQQDREDILSKRGVTFKWSKKIYGIKLSYSHPCIYEQVKPTDKVNSDLIGAMTNVVDYMKARPHSRWDMEWADQQSGNEIMYGTLTIEDKAFRKNYVSPDFVPDQSVCQQT